MEALEYLSNTYMVQVALKMMGIPYTPNMGVDLKNLDSSMEKLRDFCRIWLGAKREWTFRQNLKVVLKSSLANYLTNALVSLITTHLCN